MKILFRFNLTVVNSSIQLNELLVTAKMVEAMGIEPMSAKHRHKSTTCLVPENSLALPQKHRSVREFTFVYT